MIVRVTTTSRPQQRYDHRLRDLVRRTGDVTLATDLGVPRSTARGWIRAVPTVVMSLEVADLTEPELRQEILRLRRRVQKLAALLRLALALLQTSGFRLSDARLLDGEDKLRILRAVDQARACVPLRAVLRFLQLSPNRFQAWRRRQSACALEGQSSCPRRSPHRLTLAEVQAIGDMVTSPEDRHVPTGTLAVLAQRLGTVSASPSTWYRLVRHTAGDAVRPRQTLDPLTMRSRPVAAGEVEAAAQQQLAQPMPTSLQVFTGIIPRARQVANRLVFGGGRLDRCQQSRASQLRQLARIAAIRLHPLTGFPWNQRRRDHLAAHTRRRHLPLQRVPARPGFIEHAHGPRRVALELPHQALHRLRLVRRRPAHRRGLRAHEHREKEVLLVRINSRRT